MDRQQNLNLPHALDSTQGDSDKQARRPGAGRPKPPCDSDKHYSPLGIVLAALYHLGRIGVVR